VLLGGSDAVAPSLAETLGATLTPAGARLLLDACERRLTTAGSPLVRQGEASNEMFFLERGRVHVLLRLAAGERTPAKRLRTYGPGTIVGEMSFYSGSPRSADIVAEEDTETRCLTRERLDAIEKTQPEIGRALHRHVILTMAQRLRAANDEIGELL
jgi:SulP family sulfate permease